MPENVQAAPELPTVVGVPERSPAPVQGPMPPNPGAPFPDRGAERDNRHAKAHAVSGD